MKQKIFSRMKEIGRQTIAVLDQAEREDRDLTDREDNDLNTLFNEFDVLESLVAANDSEVQPRKAEPNIPRVQNKAGIYTGRHDIVPIKGQPAKLKTFSGMFGQSAANDLGGFDSANDFCLSVRNGLHHSALKIQNASMTEGVGADGGFLVPSRLLADMFDTSLESELVRPLATVYPVSGSNHVRIAGPDYSNRSTNLAGLSGNWLGEGGTSTPQKMKLRDITLKLNKLAIYTRTSSELAEDGLDFDRQLTSAMGNALAFDLDEAFIRGTGAGQPTGVLNDDSRITAAKDTSTSPVQAADTIRYQNIVDMWARLHPAFHKNAVWLAHPECVPQLMKMAFDDTATSKTPVYIPNQNTAGAPNGTLMGRPLLLTEHCSQLGDEGDIILVDFSQYAIGLRADATLQRSIHESWLTDEVDFRLIIRVTGLPLWDSAITLRNGNNTVSWCVTLAERA